MDADYLHPERVNTIAHLKKLKQKKKIELKKLSDVVNINKNPLKNQSSEDFICIEMSDVDVDYGLFIPKFTSLDDAGSSIIECSSGNILFSRIRPYLNKITMLPERIESAICSGEFFVLTPKNEQSKMGYLWLIFRSEFVLHQSRHLSGGSLRPRVEQEDIEDLQIPIIKDTEILEKLDSLIHETIEKYHSSLEKYRDFELKFLRAIGLSVAPKLPDLFFTIANKPSDSPRLSYRTDPLFFHPYYYELLKEELDKWSDSTGGSVQELKDICLPRGIIKQKIAVNGKAGIIPRISGECVTGNGIGWDCDFVSVSDESKFRLQKNGLCRNPTFSEVKT